jgi:Ca2+-binding RTX toxin-like protein
MIYMTKHELQETLAAHDNLDPSVQHAIIQQLITDGIYAPGNTNPGLTAEVDPFLLNPGGPPVQVLDTFGGTTIVNTDQDPALKVIVSDNSHGADVTVKGSHDVFVGTGTGNDTVTLLGTGHDTVLSGSGDDELHGNGFSLLKGGQGDDKLYGQAGGHDTLVGGAGNDTLHGAGFDTLFGGRGDDVFFDGGDGAESMKGGGGDDTFHITSHTASDTIFGGSGMDKIDFAGRSKGDVDGLTTDQNGVTQLVFNNGQTLEIKGVETLHFTDGNIKLT